MKRLFLFVLFISCSLVNLYATSTPKCVKETPITENLLFKNTNRNTVWTNSNFDSQYLMMSGGIGTSYGFGLGVRTQYRFGGVVGYGVHVGVGRMFQDATNLPFGFAVGGKLFFYKNLYLNAQYGVNWLDTKTIEAPGTYSLTTYEAVFGPSLLMGGEFFMGSSKKFGLNFALGIGLVHSEIQPEFDLGFIVKF